MPRGDGQFWIGQLAVHLQMNECMIDGLKCGGWVSAQLRPENCIPLPWTELLLIAYGASSFGSLSSRNGELTVCKGAHDPAQFFKWAPLIYSLGF